MVQDVQAVETLTPMPPAGPGVEASESSSCQMFVAPERSVILLLGRHPRAQRLRIPRRPQRLDLLYVGFRCQTMISA